MYPASRNSNSAWSVVLKFGLLMTLLAAAVGGCAGRTKASRPASSAEDQAERLRRDLSQMVTFARDRVFPALVHIHVVTVRYWNGREHKGRAIGSGTIISKDGHVLTNQHVTENGRQFKCTLADKQEITASLVGEDPLTDLAVLKLNLKELDDPAKPLPVAQFGNSDELQIGDEVMAMGSPFALSRSVTLGIVSNTERVLVGGMGRDDPEEMELAEGQPTGLFTRWIQHDALINPGNSGGPLVNLKGQIVGVNELGGSALGFAIPSNLAQAVTATLIKHGEVPRSWTGITLKPIARTGLKEGVLVDGVVKESPADQAGLRAGDVIVRLDGEPVTVKFPEQAPPLLKRISELPIGSTVKLTCNRGSAVVEAALTTAKWLKDRGDEQAFLAWGLTGLQITERLARDWRLDGTAGVWISTVREGWPAQLAEPPLNAGDVIRKIDGQPVQNLADLVKRYEQIMSKQPLPDYLLVEFDRRGKSHLTLVKPKPDEEEEPPREVRKAWIGIATQPVLQKLADRLGQTHSRGYRISRVYPKTKAAETELRVGDLIVALNGDKVAPVGMQDTGLLARKVNKLQIGDSAKLTVVREDQKHEVTVVLEPTRLTPEEAAHDRSREFDLTVREVTFFDQDENRWDEAVKGVLVDQVESAGWAGLGGIRSGDLIQKIDDREIHDLASYRQAMKAAAKAQSTRVVFVVLRGARTHFQYVEPGWKPTSSHPREAGQPKESKHD